MLKCQESFNRCTTNDVRQRIT